MEKIKSIIINCLLNSANMTPTGMIPFGTTAWDKLS